MAPQPRPSRTISIIIVLLLIGIIASSVAIWLKYDSGKPLEIYLPSPEENSPDKIYIYGAVNNPGSYSLKSEDTVQQLIQAAGGIAPQANPDEFKLYVAETEEAQSPQKININQAEAWLLQALPGIGESKAKAIIAYRENNGPFQNIYEITRVDGIGTNLFEQFKHLITAGE